MIERSASWATAVLLVPLVCACAAQPDSELAQPTMHDMANTEEAGQLTVRWSIAGSTDPSPCNGPATPKFVLTIYDDAGNPVAAYDAECAAFTKTVTLAPGQYSAEAALEGRFGVSSIPIPSVQVTSGQDLIAPVDFPSGA